MLTAGRTPVRPSAESEKATGPGAREFASGDRVGVVPSTAGRLKGQAKHLRRRHFEPDAPAENPSPELNRPRRRPDEPNRPVRKSAHRSFFGPSANTAFIIASISRLSVR